VHEDVAVGARVNFVAFDCINFEFPRVGSEVDEQRLGSLPRAYVLVSKLRKFELLSSTFSYFHSFFLSVTLSSLCLSPLSVTLSSLCLSHTLSLAHQRTRAHKLYESTKTNVRGRGRRGLSCADRRFVHLAGRVPKTLTALLAEGLVQQAAVVSIASRAAGSWAINTVLQRIVQVKIPAGRRAGARVMEWHF
jgi:hypothetical protein